MFITREIRNSINNELLRISKRTTNYPSQKLQRAFGVLGKNDLTPLSRNHEPFPFGKWTFRGTHGTKVLKVGDINSMEGSACTGPLYFKPKLGYTFHITYRRSQNKIITRTRLSYRYTVLFTLEYDPYHRKAKTLSSPKNEE